ncbi:bacteriocin immunity protein [Brevibacillus fortis]|uniref:E9imm peptide n=1 Tax=Brevibacillus fortis TaxID=2126352 RepID=A0A2P7V723_9BACL|nr:bacteriocin immunity protein [Brevibacillus fortis]MED1785824.1 bacteriocin immunity protein [Brevibacillus fortis]PSJ95014.1 hypothetical protein C7R93_13390 [Brevibacillus fortis]
MTRKLSKEELIVLIERIIKVDGTEEEIDMMLSTLEKNVPHPEVNDLIFWNDKELNAQEIVEIALNYKAILLP